MATDRASFAFDGVGGRWEWYEVGGRRIPIDEIQQHASAIAASESANAARDFKQLIAEKLRRAGRGALSVPEDGRPHLFRADGVMEIEWRLRGDQWRLYYCEPLQLRRERVMLGLYFNKKA